MAKFKDHCSTTVIKYTVEPLSIVEGTVYNISIDLSFRRNQLWI
jgi:hypothetical protein